MTDTLVVTATATGTYTPPELIDYFGYNSVPMVSSRIVIDPTGDWSGKAWGEAVLNDAFVNNYLAPATSVIPRLELVTAALTPVVAVGISMGPIESTMDTWATGITRVTTVVIPSDVSDPPAPGEPPRWTTPPIKALKGIALRMHDRPGGSEPPPYDYSPWPVETDPIIPPDLGIPGEFVDNPEPPTDPGPPPPTGGGTRVPPPTGKYLDTGVFKVEYRAGPAGMTRDAYDGTVVLDVWHLGAKYNSLLVTHTPPSGPPTGWWCDTFTNDGVIHFTPNNWAIEKSKNKEWWVKLEAQVWDYIWSPLTGMILRTVFYHVIKPRNGAWRTSPITFSNRDHGWNECATPASSVRGWQLSVGCEGWNTNVWPVQPLGPAPPAEPWTGL